MSVEETVSMAKLSNLPSGERPVGTMALDYGRDMYAPDALTAEDVPPPQKLQRKGQKGTAIYNYPRSSPEMEAIYGVKKYNRTQEKSRADVLQAQLDSERKAREEMQAKMDVMIQMMAAQGNKVPNTPTGEDMSFADARNKAKEMGINTRGMSKDKIFEAIKELDG